MVLRPEQIWLTMDCRKMTDLKSDSFDFIIDKSTIDTLLCGKCAFMAVARFLKECYRVLKIDGVYMLVSFGEPKHRLLHFYRSHVKFEITY